MTSIVTEINQKVQILDLLERYGFTPTKIGKQYRICCPFHQEQTPSFFIDIDRNRFHCFGACDRDFDVIDFVKEYDNCDFKQAVSTLKSMFFLNSELSTVKSKKPMTTKPKTTTKKAKLPHYDLAISEPFEPSKSRKENYLSKVPEGTTSQYLTQYFYIDENDLKVIKERYEFFDENNIRLDKTFSWCKRYLKIDNDRQYWVNEHKLGDVKLPLYQINRTLNQQIENKIICFTEGEKDCELLWELGIVATTYGTSPNSEDFETLKKAGIAGILIFRDNDKSGQTKAAKVSKICTDLEIPYEVCNIASEMPEGSDISDFYTQWITSNPDDDFIEFLKQFFAIKAKASVDDLKVVASAEPVTDEPDENETAKQLNFTQEAYAELYGGHYISFSDKLYRFEKTHYVICNEGVEKRRITKWCEAYSSKRTEKRHVQNIWEWVLLKTAVDPESINPLGLNLLNGTLKITWNGTTPSWELHKHNPEEIYTYVSEVEFNPNANSENCERLLAALEEPEQKIFLRTLAASLDLAKVRQHRGREVKAILFKGTGSNGKDAMREAVRTLFDNAMISTSLTDFQSYDMGRKFPLAKLHKSLISWSSENTGLARLDALQSLKAAITGESIDIEVKNIPEFSIFPQTIFIFNCNDAPRLKGSQQAIIDRWAILSFNKTFKINADPLKGELEADSRFRYDPSFIKTQVCPALLNKILLELNDLLITGIDYKPVEENFEALKKESNHLFEFADDVGLSINPDGKIYINDLWDLLKQWYIDNGTLEIEESDKGKPKFIWHEQVNKGDKNIKAANQIRQRFGELFPGISWGKETIDKDKKGQAFLQGISINSEAKTKTNEPIDPYSPKIIKAMLPELFTEFTYQELCESLATLMGEIDSREKIVLPLRDEMLNIAKSPNPSKSELSQLKEKFPHQQIKEAWILIKEYYPDEHSRLMEICK